jgi:hypothetical protein
MRAYIDKMTLSKAITLSMGKLPATTDADEIFTTGPSHKP